jgi:hypothetical protein
LNHLGFSPNGENAEGKDEVNHAALFAGRRKR